MVILVVSNTNNSLENLRKTLEVLLELFEVHLNFVLFFLASFCVGTCAGIRVSPFRLKKFFAYKRNKANLDPFHMCFTISL